jgi:hypothetical protein
MRRRARVLHDGRAAVPLDLEQAVGAVVEGASEDDPDDAGPRARATRRKHVHRRPEAVSRGPVESSNIPSLMTRWRSGGAT